MEPKVTPIAATLGAVVTDLALAQMDAATWKTVEDAFHRTRCWCSRAST